MSVSLLTLLCAVGSLALIVIDARRRNVSPASWIVVIWVVLLSSRPVTSWFDPGFGRAAGVAEYYDSGNPIERWVYFVLILAASIVIARRRLDPAALLRANVWLVVFAAYGALSVLWSDLPFVALKRWIKDFGNVLMILVLMSEANPSEAIKSVFYRVAALLIPFSYLFIRYVPELGRFYHQATGEVMFTGVTTQKNMLGALAMACAIFLVWDFLSRKKRGAGIVTNLADIGLIVLTFWTLIVSQSATSLLCVVLAGAVYFSLKLKTVRTNIASWWIVAAVLGVTWWALDSTLGLSEYVIVELLDRDLTLTTRTEVWPVLLRYSDGPIFGAGFSSFWSGPRLEELYSQFGIIQAHNGYLEVYLNGGFVGVALLVVMLLSVVHRLNRDVRSEDHQLAVIQMAILVAGIAYNFSEAAFNKWSVVWVVSLFAIVCCRSTAVRSRKAVELRTGNPMLNVLSGQSVPRNAAAVASRSRF